MLEADLKIAMEDANDIGHFYMLMEHMGYEIKHGNSLGFRLQGQAHFMFPERQNPMYSEAGIRNYIDGNLQAIEAGLKPVITYRTPYQPYKKHPKYTGFLALYVHYLYILGKIQKQQYPREDLSRVDFANRNTSFLGLFRRISSTEDYTEKG
jgi:hypothetical protein